MQHWGTQLIAANSNLKTKRLELSFARKADAYNDFVIKSGTFAHDPKKEDHYRDFLHAYLAVRILASDNVNASLLAPNGVHNVAQQLRVARDDYPALSKIQGTSWHSAMEELMLAMRDDLHSLAKMQ